MAYTETNGVIVNNLTMDQYTTLKQTNQINVNEVYSITDIDNYVDYVIRAGKVIPAGNYIFFNTNFNDFSNLPLNTYLFEMKGQSGIDVKLLLTQQDNQYVMKAIIPDVTEYEEVIATGNSLNDMQIVKEYLEINSTGYGKFLTIEHIHSQVLCIVDNFIRVNHKF